nr:nicalin-1-like isoform X1 [Tanacetum cinerariifolium]
MFDSNLSLDMSWSDSDTIDMSWINTYSEHGVNLNFHHGVEVLNRNIPAKMGSEEMKKNLVVEDDNDSMMINNSQAVLDSDEMKKNMLNEANDLMIPMLDSDLSLDMGWSDSDTFGVSWLDSYLGIQQVVFGGRSMGDWERVVFGGRSMGDWERELADHVLEVNLQHDVLDGMFTFYDSTVSTLQIFQFTRDNYQGS